MVNITVTVYSPDTTDEDDIIYKNMYGYTIEDGHFYVFQDDACDDTLQNVVAIYAKGEWRKVEFEQV